MGSATSSCPLISRFLNTGSKIGSVGFEEAIARTCVRFVRLVELNWGGSSVLNKGRPQLKKKNVFFRALPE